jgi:reductive dehalogenase
VIICGAAEIVKTVVFAMRYIDEPTYKRFITGKLARFDERNNAFSRGVTAGDKYKSMQMKGMLNIEKRVHGKTIFEHALAVAGRTVSHQLRKTMLAKNNVPYYNRRYRLKKPDPFSMSLIIKKTAQWLGADIVGITELNPIWLYSHWGSHTARYVDNVHPGDTIELPHECNYVVVIVQEMKYEEIQTTPAIEVGTDLAYSKIAMIAVSLANFIRELGYTAIPAENELGLSIPFAVDAGLGELGRSGLLITREYGPRVRISKVFTDLPLTPDRPIDLGIQKFCEKCNLCARKCPARALPELDRSDTGWDQSNATGLRKWPVRAMKCYDWWVQNGCHCSVCIRVCPWNKKQGILHKIAKLFAERGLFIFLLLKLDKVFGYGSQQIRHCYSNNQKSAVEKLVSRNDSI